MAGVWPFAGRCESHLSVWACCREMPAFVRIAARKVGADPEWLIETNRRLMPTTWSGSSVISRPLRQGKRARVQHRS